MDVVEPRFNDKVLCSEGSAQDARPAIMGGRGAAHWALGKPERDLMLDLMHGRARNTPSTRSSRQINDRVTP
jgi:hypothetical protein